jgi:hypothetical protein
MGSPRLPDASCQMNPSLSGTGRAKSIELPADQTIEVAISMQLPGRTRAPREFHKGPAEASCTFSTTDQPCGWRTRRKIGCISADRAASAERERISAGARRHADGLRSHLMASVEFGPYEDSEIVMASAVGGSSERLVADGGSRISRGGNLGAAESRREESPR